jgi:hypothetical protein
MASATVEELTRRAELAESEACRLREQVRKAEERAELATKSARDAWEFVRTTWHRPANC